jgi:hypothetical protein
MAPESITKGSWPRLRAEMAHARPIGPAPTIRVFSLFMIHGVGALMSPKDSKLIGAVAGGEEKVGTGALT